MATWRRGDRCLKVNNLAICNVRNMCVVTPKQISRQKTSVDIKSVRVRVSILVSVVCYRRVRSRVCHVTGSGRQARRASRSIFFLRRNSPGTFRAFRPMSSIVPPLMIAKGQNSARHTSRSGVGQQQTNRSALASNRSGYAMASNRSGYSACTGQSGSQFGTARKPQLHSVREENYMSEIEKLMAEQKALTSKLYDVNNQMQLVEATMASHHLEAIQEAPSREEAARAFIRNRFGTTSQQTYTFAYPSENDKVFAPTARNRRVQTEFARYGKVREVHRAGQLNR